MATDFSRVRHDPLLDWAGVQLKQGAVLLDADANELVAVLDRRFRALASDVLGRATVSATTPDAFRITVAGGDLDIGRGRLYVDGLLAENHGGGAAQFDPLLAEPRFADPLRYSAQPYLPSPPALPTAGQHLVYLDVWQREVTPLEHPALVESAVGVDTSSRLQTVWQVRLLEVGADASCATPDGELPDWAALIAPSEGRLTTGAFEVPPLDDPCELPPTGGYRGLENQLYRVEIHDPGTPGGGATFKWSRENASVGSRVASILSATELELDTLGRDDVLGFADGDWVEILDDVREFAQQSGEMRRISIPDPNNRRIVFAPALPAAMLPASFPDTVLAQQRNLRVRRWDQKGRVFRTGAGGNTVQVQDLDAAGSTGVIDIPSGNIEFLLEHGVTVSFGSVGTAGFRRGDWWVFAARTADATVEELVAAPPRGIHHHYARLGVWDVGAGAVSDCRHPWPPAGGDDCACSQCVTPESHNSGQLTIQTAVDRLRDTGGTVCLQPGNYVIGDAPVRIAGARSIAIRGQGPATVLAAPGTALRIEASTAVTIEKLAVVSLGKQSAIDVRTVLGLRLRELEVSVFGESDVAAISLSGLCASACISDNRLVAHDGIRTDTRGVDEAPRFALLAAVAIERNLLSCTQRGIALDGVVAHLWQNRIAGNQFSGCRNSGVRAPGFALPGSSLHIEGNNFAIGGHGIHCGVGGAWIGHNRLHFQGQGERATPFDGIALIPGLDQARNDQSHVLANQISGFSGAGIAIRAPIRELIVKLNIVSDCGSGIVMSADAESDSVSIENNHLRNIVGSDARDEGGIVSGIAVVRTQSATVAGNQIREVATARQRGAAAGINLWGVARSRVDGNVISEIGPLDDSGGTAAGIVVRGPMAQTEVANNQVRRDDEAVAGGANWYALMVLGDQTPSVVGSVGTVVTASATRSRRASAATTRAVTGAVSHTTGLSTVRIDESRTLVFSNGRPFISAAALDFATAVDGAADDDAAEAPAAAAVARGSVATITGNTLCARGGTPAVELQLGTELMFSDNRCELFDRGRVPAVRLQSPRILLHGNRVRNVGKISIEINDGNAENGRITAVGNITSGEIHALTPQWTALNIKG